MGEPPWRDERFSRSRIVLGDAGLERLWNAHVVVVGYGAVGSAAAEALVRSGVGHIRIIDADVYDMSNMNRQLGCDSGTVGKPKVEVGAAHFAALSPRIDVESVVSFVNAEAMEDVFRRFSDGIAPEIVVDAIDTLAPKCHLIAEAMKRRLHIVSSMGAGAKSDITQIRFADLWDTYHCGLSKAVRKRL